MAYDPKLLRWFAGLTPAEGLAGAIDADAFRREVGGDLASLSSSGR